MVRTFREVRIWSPRHAAEFAKELGVDAAPSAEAAVRGAEVVVTVTTSQTPVLCGAWLSAGVHTNAVGARCPDWPELDDERSTEHDSAKTRARLPRNLAT